MLGIIRSGINVAQHELSLVSNNLANSKTTGFKTSAGRFHDQYSLALDGIAPTNGMGSNIAKSSRIHSQRNHQRFEYNFRNKRRVYEITTRL